MKNYLTFDRESWSSLLKNTNGILNCKEIDVLGSKIESDEIKTIYAPLAKYLSFRFENKLKTERKESNFLGEKLHTPFIIAISGSVASGKTVTSFALKQMLELLYPDLTIERMTTDGFIYPNQELEKKHLMDRKGFPESYNVNLLNDFLSDLISEKEDIIYPLYSQEISDVVPNKMGHLYSPDILIIEGINTLQLPQEGNNVPSDFFDFSIYLDVDEDLLKKWFIRRVKNLLELNKDNVGSFYYNLAQNTPDPMALVYETWHKVNLTNLRENIDPTKERAKMILHKKDNHLIDRIYLRKY